MCWRISYISNLPIEWAQRKKRGISMDNLLVFVGYLLPCALLWCVEWIVRIAIGLSFVAVGGLIIYFAFISPVAELINIPCIFAAMLPFMIAYLYWKTILSVPTFVDTRVRFID
jgi:hypothetical protein